MSGGNPTATSGVEEIAVVGLSCRLPGAAGPAEFWRLLCDGVDAVGEAPDDRWAGDSLSPRRGGFLDRIDRFDAGFFGISPREAVAMDPQQRLVLELSWEALEDARIVPATLRGSRTGVFVGVMWDDYAVLLDRLGQGAIGRHTLTGSSRAIIANRVSHILGLRGTSLAVDTAQSSSLVAVHLACESLRRGECTAAIAGGVNLNILAESTVGALQFGALSPDGRCFTFDARANGYARGEGGAVVVLKTLSDALADGDRIYCVIAGGAANNEGTGDGTDRALTVPTRSAQEDVIQQAYRQAAVDPGEVQYVELHGTGTKVGDPVEAAALGGALGVRRPADSALPVGSVKTNIGHLEGAAGIAGLLKVVLSLRHRRLPPSLNFDTPNPDIPLDELRLRLHTRLSEWPDPARRLVAGVSSFGMGGTNCHLVLAEAPASAPTGESAAPVAALPVVPWVLSGRTESALRGQADRLLSRVEGASGLAPVDVGWSLVSTRAPLEHRAVVLGEDRDELTRKLAGLAAGQPGSGVVSGVVGPVGGVGFVFSGQGSQRLGMGRELAAAFPVFAEAFDEVCSGFARLLPGSLREVVWGDDADVLNRTGWAQPALFAFEVALCRLLGSWGVVPEFVVGHSIGELVAAYVAGMWSLADACRVVAARAGLMQGLPSGGVMLAVEAGESEVVEVGEGVAGWGVVAGIAAVNAVDSVVVSGEADAVETVGEVLRGRGRRVSRLRVSHAFHSPLMEPMLGSFAHALAGVEFGVPSMGMSVDVERLRSAGYWVEQVREPVRFADMVRGLGERGVTHFVEVGPDGVLVGPGSRSVEGVFVAAQRGDRSEVGSVLAALGVLYAGGAGVDWGAVFAGTGASVVDLPTYAFQRERYWINESGSRPAHTALPDRIPADHQLPAADRGTLADRVAVLPRGERTRYLLDIVRREAAVVLGHEDVHRVAVSTPFRQLGFDSLMAVELRDRLSTVSRAVLSRTLLFDYPTTEKLATHLGDVLCPENSADIPKLHNVAMDLRNEIDLIDTMDIDALVQRAFDT